MKNTFCQRYKDFNGFNYIDRLTFLSFVCELTEISMNMSISFDAEKERKWAIKSVDLTKSYATLTDPDYFSASLLEMMLMIKIAKTNCVDLKNELCKKVFIQNFPYNYKSSIPLVFCAHQ
ncbi:MAG: hypothetical protein LBQ39_06235, partial [Tannerellaceae bacterium]|nr:hypothetical protein [Tannerellaceae bacterium]